LFAAAVLAAGCGDDRQPGKKERDDAASVNRELRGACNGARVRAITAVGHGSYGRTSGFLVLCADGTVEAFDKDGGNPGDTEREDAISVAQNIKRLCGPRGADAVTALGHGSYGRTSGYLIRCVDSGEFHPTGR
jgi:hypothetical protein